MKTLATLIVTLLCSILLQAQVPTDKTVPGVFLIKYKSNALKSSLPQVSKEQQSLANFISSLQPESIVQKFPNSKKPTNNKQVDLTRIYQIAYKKPYPVEKIVAYIASFSMVEWVQPVYINEPLLVPDDPNLGNQWYIDTVKAKKAWDITTGDTNVVIGISDTGFDIFHEDLKDQIKYNYNDPINGIDDDNDGYIDNYRGWDIQNNDNNPDHDVSDKVKHGTTVAGIACAAPNNKKGICGLGYNCKVLPIRSNISSSGINNDYESIVYLADHGAKVINCSWGGYTKQPLGQDIINYATFNRDALVIGAAGNYPVPYYIYPASYDNAYSVAGTNRKNEFWTQVNNPTSDGKSGSGYGFKVDVSAPAVSIFTTMGGNSYTLGFHGTSFAAPLVSGIAGLVRSKNPSFTAQQTAERMRTTCDNIDTIAANAPYKKLMGKGQINAYRSVADSLRPSVRLVDYEITGLHGALVRGGDTAILRGKFVNYLYPVKNVVVSISDYNGYLASVKNGKSIDTLGTMDTITNFEVMFTLKKSIPYDAKVALLLNYANADGYVDWQFVTLDANPSFLHLEARNIATTVSAVGSIGYSYIAGKEGLGFLYKNKQTLYSGIPTFGGKSIYSGLVLAKDTGKILLNYGSTSDYSIEEFPSYITTDSSTSVVCSYNGKYQTNIDFNFKINQKVTAWPADSSFVLYEYDIINTSYNKIDSMYAGLLMDWGVSNQFVNKAVVNTKEKYAYFYSVEPETPYVGIKVLRGDTVNHHIIEVNDTLGEVVKVNDFDGLSKQDILQSMMTSKTKPNFTNVLADDLMQMINVQKKKLVKGDTLKLAFALFAAENEQHISKILARAEYRFKQLNNIPIREQEKNMLDGLRIVPSVISSQTACVQFESSKEANATISITNSSGMILKTENIKIQCGLNTKSIGGIQQNGVYYISINVNGRVYTTECVKY